jgi:hypothetical protein
MPTPFSYNFVGVSGFSGATGGNGLPGTSLLTATQSNTFSAGQAIYRAVGSYVLAQANAISSSDVTGIIQNATSTALTAVINGNISGLTGLVDGNEYWLSDTTAGALVSAQPTATGSVIKPLLIATGTSTGVVVTYPGALIGSTNYGTSGYYGKWTSAQNLGTGLITDNGSTVIIGGNLSATGNFYALNSYPTYLSAVGVSATNLTIAGGWVSEAAVTEYTTVSAAAPGATIQFDTLTQGVLVYTSNVANNWTLNVRGNSTTPLSSILNTGQTITLSLMTSAAGSGYYQTGMTIDGATATAKWQGGTAPSSGDTSAIDLYTFSITKVSATPSYIVLGSVSKFA